MSSPAAKIRYLASCHEADNRETAIFDLFHRDVRHRHFATGTEVLVSGIQDALAIPLEIGGKAIEEAALYKRVLDRVSARLTSWGSHVHRTFLVAGTVVDLVVEREGKLFGIDLIGQGGALGAALDLKRYRMLRRAGLSVFPLPLPALDLGRSLVPSGDRPA